MQYEDNTGKSRSQAISYNEKIVKLKEAKVGVTVKLSALWDAKTHVFHGAKVIHGVSRVTSTFKHLVNGCRVRIEALFADSEFSSRPNVFLQARSVLGTVTFL